MAIGLLLLGLLIGLAVWMLHPYSPLKKQFQRQVNFLIGEYSGLGDSVFFTESDFAHLPSAIQKYIKHCGYIGMHKMCYFKMAYHDVDFLQGRDGPTLTIDYTQYNFINEPTRLALVESRLYGIPFEGFDYYQNGTGGMKGVIAKSITLFDQKGPDMDRACLVTFLAECLFVPTVLLQDYISFEELNDYEVAATIVYGGQTASGVFTFNERYEMVSFTSHDRALVAPDGSVEYVPWSALCEDYDLSPNGLKHPTKFRAVWNYPDGDFVYFDGDISEITYGLPQSISDGFPL